MNDNHESKEREAVKSAYNNKTWHNKVAKMPDSQIAAVYIHLRAQGKI